MFNHFNKLTFIGITFLTLTLSLAAQANVVDSINKSFNVASDPSLDLKNINGHVTITAWDKNMIEVNATITAETLKEREQVAIIIANIDDNVSIESKYDKNNGRNHNKAKVDYKIKVPTLTVLSSIELVNGALNIIGVEGDIAAELVNGSFNASGASANTHINSVNGSVTLNYQDNIKHLNKIIIETVNGGVDLHVPQSINAEVSIETVHGSIKNDFGLTVDKHNFVGRELRGTIGTGKVDIEIETVNGAVKLLHN